MKFNPSHLSRRGAAIGLALTSAIVLLAVSAAAVAMPSDGQPAARPDAGASGQTGSSVDHAISFRETLGLRADRAYVEQLDSDPAASRALGIATTAQELAQVNDVQFTV